MSEKPPFALTIKLESYNPDAVQKAVDFIHTVCVGRNVLQGPHTAQITIHADRDRDLEDIRIALELFLRDHLVQIGGEIRTKGPLLRPRLTVLPMDRTGWAEPGAQAAPDGAQQTDAADPELPATAEHDAALEAHLDAADHAREAAAAAADPDFSEIDDILRRGLPNLLDPEPESDDEQDEQAA